jgi:hypothetical protein
MVVQRGVKAEGHSRPGRIEARPGIDTVTALGEKGKMRAAISKKVASQSAGSGQVMGDCDR